MAVRNQHLYDAIEKQRNWVPGHDADVIFRKWRTADGRRLYAEAYGYRAWCLVIRWRLQAASLEHHERLQPIASPHRLKGGFKAGDRVEHRGWGAGMIISIDDKETSFDFDVSGLTAFDTPKAHYLLKKLA